jgi:hypothetical protein
MTHSGIEGRRASGPRRRWAPGIGLTLIALLAVVPTTVQAQRPDSRAVEAAREMVAKRASAGQVAAEMTRAYRQSTGQTAVILSQVGFDADAATSAFVRDLRLAPEQATPALRAARYDASGVAAGLAAARISPARVVGALGAARYSADEIVRAQRSTLRRDATSAWTDLERSGLLDTSSDALMFAVLREMQVASIRDRAQRRDLLKTMALDTRARAGMTASVSAERQRAAGVSLGDVLDSMRDVYGWTAGQALAWLSGETSLAGALEMVEEEYGLDDDGLVAAIQEAYAAAGSQFDRVAAFVLLLQQKDENAKRAVIESMATVHAVPSDVVVEVVQTIYGTTRLAADRLVEIGVWTHGQAVDAMLAAGSKISDVAEWLHEKIGATAAAELLVERGAWTVSEAATWLWDTVDEPTGDVARWILDAGGTVDDAADWLVSTGIGAVAVATGLKDVGVRVVTVIGKVRDRVSWAVSDIASWLVDAGYTVGETASILDDATGASRGDIVDALGGAGFPAGDIWPAMVSTFDLTAQQLASLMADDGVALNEIAGTLVHEFGLQFQEALAIASQFFGG